MSQEVFLVAEGVADMTALERLCTLFKIEVAGRIVCRGKTDLDARLVRYRQAAATTGIRYLILRDLDRDASCAAELRTRDVMKRTAGFELRLAVRALESWVLADFESFRRSCGFGRRNPPLPADRDELDDPKQKLLDLVRAHGSARARRDIARPGALQRQTSPGYGDYLCRHLASEWRPEVARRGSTSLDRAMRFLEATR